MKPFSKLRQLLEKSTPGEWQAVPNPMRSDGLFIRKDGHGIMATQDTPDNATFIAEVHNALPRVLEALDLAVEALEQISVFNSEDEIITELSLNALAKIKALAGK